MGFHNRAVLIENGIRQTCYFGKDTIADDVLFWGPEITAAYLRKMVQNDCDIRYSDFAAAVVDLDSKRLLFFGGEMMRWDIPCRRQYIHLMRHNWPGYNIRYADNGIDDVCTALGLEPIEDGYLGYGERYISQNISRNFVDCCGDVPEGFMTVSQNGGLDIYPLYGPDSGDEFPLFGEEVLAAAGRVPALREFVLETTAEDSFPVIGIHLVPEEKMLYFWQAACDLCVSRMEQSWPGWKVHYWGDDFEEHIRVTGDRLQLIPPPGRDFNAEISARVTSVWGRDLGEMLGIDPAQRFYEITGE